MNRFSAAFADPAGSPIRELFPYLGRPGLISFAGGYPSPALLDGEGLAQASALAWEEAAACLQYGPTEGQPALRAALAALSQTRGIACEPHELLVTTGSQQGFDLLVRVFIEPGDVVIVEAPAYSAAIQALRLAGARIEQVPTDAQGLQVERLEEMLRGMVGRDRPKLLYTVPTFSNPSGSLLSIERREKLVSLAREHGFLVVEDDPYGELRFTNGQVTSLYEIGARAGGRNPVAYLSSLSKTVAPSLRIGWLVADREILRRCAVAKQTTDLCTSPLAQAIATKYLESGRYPAAVQRASAEYGLRMRTLAGELSRLLGDRLSWCEPGGGMFLWARAAGDADPACLFEAAVAANVLYVPGKAFYAHNPELNTMRLSFAAPDAAAVREGVARLACAFLESSHH